jgi:hypothetical protein
MTAPHTPFPTVPNQGGPILANPKIVTVSTRGHPYGSQLAAFGRWIVGTSWMTTAGREYGVHAGTYAGNATVAPPNATSMMSTDVEAWLAAAVAAGQVPAPRSASDRPLYVVFFPSGISVSLPGGLTSCTGFGGYHGEVQVGSVLTSYAFIPLCADMTGLGEEREMEWSASHEIMEAATDPLPISEPTWVVRDPTDPWSYIGGEVADFCSGRIGFEANHAVQPVFSAIAAAAGGNPCIPVTDSEPYVSVTSMPAWIPSVTAGSMVEFTLTGWSTAPASDWQLFLSPLLDISGSTATFSTMLINNGRMSTLRITVPGSTPSGTPYSAIIYSIPNGSASFNLWPVAFVVQ